MLPIVLLSFVMANEKKLGGLGSNPESHVTYGTRLEFDLSLRVSMKLK